MFLVRVTAHEPKAMSKPRDPFPIAAFPSTTIALQPFISIPVGITLSQVADHLNRPRDSYAVVTVGNRAMADN